MRKIETTTSKKGVRSHKVRFRLEGVQTSETFATERDAVTFAKWLDALGAREAVNRLYAGEARDKVPVLNQMAFDHIRLLTGIEDGTRVKYSRMWDQTWAELVGEIPADQFSADHFRQAVNELAKRYSTKTMQNQRGLLSGVVSRCIEQGYLSKNPTKGIRLPEGKRVAIGEEADDDDEMVCLTHDDWELLYVHTAAPYQPFVRFLVGTGCRWGEAVVLRAKDIDLRAGVVRIRRALKWSPDGAYVIGPPKTKKSKRTIALAAENIDDVRELVKDKSPNDLVFTAPRGGMIAHRTFWSKTWRRAIWRARHCDTHRAAAEAQGCKCGTADAYRCKVHESQTMDGCGCPGVLGSVPRIHDLRHTHASWLLGEGIPIHVVQARLGHESIQTTVDRYTHLMPDAQLLAAQAAQTVFSGEPRAVAPIDIARLSDDDLEALARAVAAEVAGRSRLTLEEAAPEDLPVLASASI